jgi:amino acid adenylation domain-containing protein
MTGEALQGFRLSPQQKRLWRLQQEDGRVWRAQCALALRGPLDAGRLRAALRRATARHEILRTLFRVPPGLQLPVQVVLDTAEPSWTVAEPGLSFEEVWRRELERPADPAAVAPLRATLVEDGPEEHVLILSLPALCADARSLSILVRELGRTYGGGSNGEEVLQYAQFAEWQLGLLEDEQAAAEGREHWARRLPDDAALDRGGRGAVAACPVPLDAATAAAVLSFASRTGGTPEAVLLAVWQALQARLAGRDGVAVGWGCDGRGHEVLEGALGLFSRWLPIAASSAPEASLSRAAVQTGAALEEAAGWQEHFIPQGDPAGPWPGFHAGFELRRWEAPEWPRGVNGVTASWLRRAARTERFHLALIADLEGETLSAEVQHDAAQLDGAKARRIAGWFATLLRHAMEAPAAPLGELEILDGAERARLVDEVNRTAVDVPAGRCLHELFAEQAARTPAAPAVALGDRGLTFAELDARANRLAHHLRRLGVGPESAVGLCVERSPEMLVGLLGILKAGGAYLPLDPIYPQERLRRMIGDARAAALVTRETLRAVLPADGPPAVLLDTHADLLERESAAAPADGAGPENLAYVLFTSGSTGVPKGVMVEHRSVVNLAAALRRAIYEHHPGPLRVSVNASLAFDASVKQVIQLLAGHTLCILPDEVRADGAALAAHIARHRIEVLDCTPSQLAALVESGLPALPRVILAGGEALPEGLRAHLANLPGHAVYDVYGPTECTVDTTAHRLRPGEAEPTLGGPLANVRVYVLDRWLRLVPEGVAGELFVGGAGVSRGYLGRPDLTAERFLPDPFGGAPGGRLYRTGDRVALQPGGTLRFLGRVDHQVKLRGFRIELGEIEASLGEHPQVRQAVVLLREDAPGEPRLAAYVTLRQQHGAAAAELRAFLRERLPEFMVPAAVAVLPRLPLTRNGKVDREALPAPDPGRDLDAPYAPPESRAEQELAALWREVLEVARVGLDDNFFDLGGNSVLMIQLHDRMRRELGAEVSIVELFRRPTVRSLARSLETEEAAPSFHASEERARRQALAMQRQRRAQEDRRRAQ